MLSYSLIFLTAVAFASAQTGSQTVNVILVADTGKLFSKYEHKPPSQNHLKPTSLGSSPANKEVFMVTTKDRAVAGQATANLTLKAKVGEPFRFTGLSETANMDAAIVVYDISKYSGDEIINKPKFTYLTKGIAVPLPDVFPQIKIVDREFWPHETAIMKKGTSVYKIRFGMYHRGRVAEHQKLFGYFEFLATLNVKF